MSQIVDTKATASEWKGLYTVGGVAALLAGLLFRRNLAVEVGLFSSQASPVQVSEWFALLQDNRLLGLTFLHIFDVVNYALVGLMFLALYRALKQSGRSAMAIAGTAALAGIVVYFTANTAFSMLALSDRYAAAASAAERNVLLAAGEALLAVNRFSMGAHPGSGGYLSLLLVALAGLITSTVMLRSHVFNRVTAYIGILAGLLDLVYCAAYPFVPAGGQATLAVSFIPAAGLFWMVWPILVGWKLYRLGRQVQ